MKKAKSIVVILLLLISAAYIAADLNHNRPGPATIFAGLTGLCFVLAYLILDTKSTQDITTAISNLVKVTAIAVLGMFDLVCGGITLGMIFIV